MVHSYLKYEELRSIGNIYGGHSNIALLDDNHLLSPMNGEILLWDLKTNTVISVFKSPSSMEIVSKVTSILKLSDLSFAAGYENGAITIFHVNEDGASESDVVFRGHKSGITCLSFDPESNILFSGSKDTVIIAWDLANECGLYRLKGHKNQVTDMCLVALDAGESSEKSDLLVSSSKDGLIKVWDLSLRECVETVVDHPSEISKMLYLPERDLLLTGSVDMELRIFKVDRSRSMEKFISFTGSLTRQAHGKVVDMKFSESRSSSAKSLVCISSSDKFFEFYSLLTTEDIEKKISRKKKRMREKGLEISNDFSPMVPELEFISTHKCDSKIRAFLLGKHDIKSSSMHMIIGRGDNCLEKSQIRFSNGKSSKSNKDFKIEKGSLIERSGHRKEIDFVCISPDDSMIASLSSDSIKLWNSKSCSVIRTIACDQPVCCIFTPKSEQIVIGLKSGLIQIYDIAKSAIVEVTEAHDGSVKTMSLRPDKRGFASGGSDKKVHFWDFEWLDEENRLSVTLMRTFEVSEEVLFLAYSPDQKLLGLSLLDCTVKIFYHDTLKLFLTLYGHKLPVTAFDISYDNTIMVTSSVDKSVKIWGLDFGDCRKSLAAHSDPVTGVSFVANTHYFFSCGKDHEIKYWDADRFQLITTVGQHAGKVSSIACSRFGGFFVSSSEDRTIKLWNRTEEQIFLEEEREKELENIFLNNNSRKSKSTVEEDEQGDDVILDESSKEAKVAGEKIFDALNIAHHELMSLESGKISSVSNPYILNYGQDTRPEFYLLKEVEKIKSHELESGLLLLPFQEIKKFLSIISIWVTKNWNMPLVSRLLKHIISTHRKEIDMDNDLKENLRVMAEKYSENISSLDSVYGVNLAALGIISKLWDQNHNANFFGDSLINENNNVNNIKRKYQR